MRRALVKLLKECPGELGSKVDSAALGLARSLPERAAIIDDGRLFLLSLFWWEAADGCGTAKAFEAPMLDWTRRATVEKPRSWYEVRLVAARLLLLALGVGIHEAAATTRLVASNFPRDDDD